MKYNPDDKKDFNYEPGIYRWVVVDAEEKTGLDSGRDYIKLTLAVNIPPNKEPVKIYENLSSHPNSLYRVEQYCLACGRDFNDADMPPESCIGNEGYAEFDYGKPSPKTGKRYLKVVQYITDSEPPEEGSPDEDDIPF